MRERKQPGYWIESLPWYFKIPVTLAVGAVAFTLMAIVTFIAALATTNLITLYIEFNL